MPELIPAAPGTPVLWVCEDCGWTCGPPECDNPGAYAHSWMYRRGFARAFLLGREAARHDH